MNERKVMGEVNIHRILKWQKWICTVVTLVASVGLLLNVGYNNVTADAGLHQIYNYKSNQANTSHEMFNRTNESHYDFSIRMIHKLPGSLFGLRQRTDPKILQDLLDAVLEHPQFYTNQEHQHFRCGSGHKQSSTGIIHAT